MKKIPVSIARITRPSPMGAVPRHRLFRVIDKGRNSPVVWVSAPAGSGKTTLISSYISARGLPSIWYRVGSDDSNAAEFFHYMGLAGKMAAPRKRRPLPHFTTEYRMGLPAFTRGFFENIYRRLKPPFVLVLDNYHEAPQSAAIHEIIAGAVDTLPGGGNIIIASRSTPPPALSRFVAGGKFCVIEPREIALTPEESKAIIEFRHAGHGKKPGAEEALAMHRRIGGWVGGLVLLLEGAARGGQMERSLENLPNDAIFEYFASEIFTKMDSDTRNFLMKTAFFSEMTARMASDLSGLGRSARLLSYLGRNHCFTEKRLKPQPVYTYHPLFREFLLTRAREAFSPRRLTSLKRRAARVMEKAGFVEDAASAYCEARDWDGLSRVLLSHAGTLLTQGRCAALGRWLRCFPGAYLGKEPWLRHWLGASCARSSPGEARTHFEQALRKFNSLQLPAGAFLSWAGAIKAVFYGFDDFGKFSRWIKLYPWLVKKYPDFPSEEIRSQVVSSMCIALTFREPWHADMERWAEEALTVAEHSDDMYLRAETGFALGHYYRWKGDGPRCRMIIDSLQGRTPVQKAAPMPRLTLSVEEAAYFWESGNHEACERTVSEGLELARASGSHLIDHMLLGQGAASALATEDLEKASGLLQKMSTAPEKGSRYDRSFYHFLLAWEALVRGENSLAYNHATTAVNTVMGLRCLPAEVVCRALLATTLFEKGEQKLAEAEMKRVCAQTRKTGYGLTRYLCLTIEAWTALRSGRNSKASRKLRELFALGRERGILKHLLFRPPVMAELCVRALEEGIEVEHVRGLVRKCGLMPAEPPLDVDEWPWPVRIYTLGRFSLVLNDAETRFTGRAQARPLLMLKAMVALGGRGVRATELYDRLWPDSDGDSAMNAFNTTLHRLRKILGNDEAVELSHGLVSLNPRLVWVDTWAFERLLGQADGEIKAGRKKPGGRLIDKALRIYQGPFMSTDKDLPLYLPMAERLRSKFLRYIRGLGRLYDGAGEFDRAIERFKRGIEVDVLAEEFYVGLMLCYRKLDRKAEAMSVYRNLERNLSILLGVEPSPQSRAIYTELRGGVATVTKKK